MTAPQVTDTRLARIRGLLAMAESTNYPDEAETFTAKAQALMAEWGVDHAMLAADDPAANKVGDRVVPVVAPYAMGKTSLLFAICKALGVGAVRRTGSWGGKNGNQNMHLFGLASDLERAEMLFTSLLLQAPRLIRQAQEEDWGAYAFNPRTWTRDWQEGYARRIGDRLKAAESVARQEAPSATPGGVSQALVFVRRDELVAEAVAKAYPKLRTGAARRVGSGYGAGQESGSRTDLGGRKLSGGSRALGR